MFAVGFAMHCGTDARNGFDGAQCAGGLPEDCGKACNDDNGCGNGLHCSSALTCTAECGASVPCPTGSACSPRGRCELVQVGQDSGDFGGDGGLINPGDGAVPPDACADINVVLDKVTPTVLFLIDQSKSMSDYQFPANSGVTRWDALKAALIGNNGIIKTLENDVSFGVSIYSWKSGEPQCPTLLNEPWKIGNYAAINTLYSPAATSDNTPTAESIMKAVGFNDAGTLSGDGFAGATTPGPKILVLATDGNPDSCADPDSDWNGNGAGPKAFTVWATKQAYTAGISTYVISVGTDIDQVHQQAVANVGQGLPESQVQDAAAVYRPTNTSQLVDALNKVILGIRSCTFTVNGSIVPGTEEKGSVTLNGAPLTYKAANGWKLNSQTELEITGTACETLKTTFDAQVQVRFPCGTVKIPLPN